MEELGQGIDRSFGTTTKVERFERYPATVNDPEVTARAQEVVRALVGPDALETGLRLMGGEDMAFYLREITGCFIFLGVRNEAIGAVHPVHTPLLLIDEAALPVGVRAHSLMALDYLHRHASDAQTPKR